MSMGYNSNPAGIGVMLPIYYILTFCLGFFKTQLSFSITEMHCAL